MSKDVPKGPRITVTPSYGSCQSSPSLKLGLSPSSRQVHRKSVKRGFEFTLMVVGESGLGKSTLVNSLFLSDLYTNRKMPPAEERVARTTEIEKTTMEIEEKGRAVIAKVVL